MHTYPVEIVIGRYLLSAKQVDKLQKADNWLSVLSTELLFFKLSPVLQWCDQVVSTCTYSQFLFGPTRHDDNQTWPQAESLCQGLIAAWIIHLYSVDCYTGKLQAAHMLVSPLCDFALIVVTDGQLHRWWAST